MASSIVETIPVEVTGEFFRHVSDFDTLLSLSCVCHKWRLLVLPRLFARVRVDPTLNFPIYQMVNSPGYYFGKYIKKLAISASFVKAGPCAEFYDFIRHLTKLNSVEFYVDFDLLLLSVDDMELLAYTFKTVHTLVVSNTTRSFPLPLIFLCPKLKTLELKYASTTWTSTLAEETLELKQSMQADTGAAPVELEKLTLYSVSDLDVVTSLFSENHVSYSRFRSLEVNYFEGLHPDPVEFSSTSAKVGQFLKRWGGTIEELHLNAQRLTDLSHLQHDFHMAGGDLERLNSLQVFKATLSVAKETRKLESSPQDWLVPIVKNLPSPHLLKYFSFTFRVFLHNDTPVDILICQLRDFLCVLDNLLYHRYTGLKKVDIQFHFKKDDGKEFPLHWFSTVSACDYLQLLQSRGGIDLVANAFDYRPSAAL